MIRKDGSSKPAYDELMNLIHREWWIAPTKFMTDSKGEIQFSGFFGEYELTYEGTQKSLAITKENAMRITVEV